MRRRGRGLLLLAEVGELVLVPNTAAFALRLLLVFDGMLEFGDAPRDLNLALGLTIRGSLKMASLPAVQGALGK